MGVDFPTKTSRTSLQSDLVLAAANLHLVYREFCTKISYFMSENCLLPLRSRSHHSSVLHDLVKLVFPHPSVVLSKNKFRRGGSSFEEENLLRNFIKRKDQDSEKKNEITTAQN